MPINLPEKSTSRDDDGNILKRRLLGAAVLIALAVIFLPLLLDGSGSESRFRRVEQLRVEPPRILDRQGKPEIQPEKPSATHNSPTQNPPTQNPQRVENPPVKKESVTKPVAVEEETTSSSQKPENKQLEVQQEVAKVPVPQTTSSEIKNNVAWVVQAASFSDESNALVLRDELRAAQFPAFVSAGKDSGQQLVFRVKVGPITDREQAVIVQQQVEGVLNLKTLIRKYP